MSDFFGAAVGSLVNTGLQMWQQNEQNEFNSGEALANRNWQEYMSNTAYRRAVGDLKAAGLSPMLAYGKTFGPASTPGGSSASAANTGTSYSSAFTSGAMVKATLEKVRAETAKEDAAAELNSASARKIESETPLAASVQEAGIIQHQASAGQARANEANIRQEMTNFQNRVGNVLADTGVKESLSALNAMLRDKAAHERIRIIEDYRHNMPAQVRELVARAQKLVAEAKLLGLEVPEYVSKAAFWESEAGKVRPYVDFGSETLRNLPIRRR